MNLGRLSLKEKKLKKIEAPEDVQIAAFWQYSDQSIGVKDRAIAGFKNKKDLKAFMNHCCVCRNYVFSGKKCGSAECSMCCPPRLPTDMFSTIHRLPDPVLDASGEHYKPFHELHGQVDTTEVHYAIVSNKGHH